ncbi:putative histone-lysine N-methyltransferase PRDM6 isoform X1 [Acropora muricata]|uniref:putative histone-lysine N-methyltransferase PRDM6 isoform X1 n=2 Tax=Acropora muricata TaxID=159855 RepID=UPI001CF458E4|nr:putative histone-lysine N-methyltransferase PRDM6 [Acropora millepora]
MDLEIKELQYDKPLASSSRKRVISCEPATYKRAKVSPPLGSSVPPQRSRYTFSDDDIQKCLFSKSGIKPVISQDMTCFWCDAGSTDPSFACPRHKHETPAHRHKSRLSLPLKSLPPEVELCVSSIPGEGYGVCAKRSIPVGAWIGPYEGKYLRPEDLPLFADTSYMWEIFKDGELVGYVDGSDEKLSSWMRFIRCARHKQEQNLFAFQYLGKVYYRAFKAIQPGEEMLVWYDEKYQQYLGLPSVMFDMANVKNAGANFPPEKSGTVLPKTDNSCSKETSRAPNQFPPSPPSSVPSPSSPPSPDSQPSSPNKSRSSEPAIDQQCKVRSAFDFSSASVNREGPQFPPSPPLSSPGSIRSETASPNYCENESRISLLAQKPVYTGVTELSLWKCGQCKKSFPQRIMLQVHVCNEAPKKPYQCGHCTQSFSSPAHLRAHAVNHVSKKPFKCGYCSRAFAGATTLNNHIRTHTGEKPFVCDKCGKNFTQGSQLSRHQRIPGDCVKQD